MIRINKLAKTEKLGTNQEALNQFDDYELLVIDDFGLMLIISYKTGFLIHHIISSNIKFFFQKSSGAPKSMEL